MSRYNEDLLIVKPAIALFSKLGWQTANCYEETFGSHASLGRETSNEVVLLSHLQPALESLNPDLPPVAFQLAIEELSRDRSLMSPANANREIYLLLKDGVKVTYRDNEGTETFETVRLIDWEHPENNDYFLASQFWISSELYKRRPDLIGFVNGIPLVLVEAKASWRNLEVAYRDNLRDYKDTIPHLFWYNAIIILSNGADTRVGSMTAPWEHFNEWKKINSEGEQGIVSLETVIRGICEPARLLDMIENFTIFAELRGGLAKLVAKNHQYLGVNNAFEAIQHMDENRGRLGVFWHTQGSGKSYSMIFFAQKVLRKLPGNWTFIVITDRRDLDDQIYKNFAGVGAVTEPEERVRAQSGENLKQLLKEDHRYVFTLIHKFHTDIGEVYPVLSDRSDIIVLTDEAHRSQYDTLALNMRNALPNAAFLAFTGTPLMVGEERTRRVFGEYVSIYNFAQSVKDNATVPLYYENRIPELQLTNENLNADMEHLLEAAEIDERQEQRLEQEFSREYHLIVRDDRLEKIAEDIVLHFMGRGFPGKAMVVSVDKATALRMYDKVQKYWKIHLAKLERGRIYETVTTENGGTEIIFGDGASGERPTAGTTELEETYSSGMGQAGNVGYMQQTDMAVVISQGQNEIADMREKGLDILPHRKRMVEEDLDTKFKDPNDPLRIVFVCAMWMTGFDVPSCSTIYLDKPMRNHTLMQTIARANRVWGEKVNGLIVDYIGVFRDLQRALAIYGTASGGGVKPGDVPVETKQALIKALEDAIHATRTFLSEHGVDLDVIHGAAADAKTFRGVEALKDCVNALLVNDDTKRAYLNMADYVDRLFKAILPDPAANRFSLDRKAIVVIAEQIRSLIPSADISEVMVDVEELLDRSIAPTKEGYHIRDKPYLDLSTIDFELLKKQFEKNRKRIEAEKLRGLINSKLAKMIRLNRTRMDFYQKFQELIEEYNIGVKNVDAFFTALISLARELNEEEKRGISENLSEEELALFDLLTKPDPKLSRKEKERVKVIAKELLDTLKSERLVLDWRKRQQSRAAVQLQIETVLDKLPKIYEKPLYDQKCQVVYQHVYDSYYGAGRSIYSLQV